MQLKAPIIRISELNINVSLLKLSQTCIAECNIAPFIGNIPNMPVFNNTLGINMELSLNMSGIGELATLKGSIEGVIESYDTPNNDVVEIINHIKEFSKLLIVPLQMSIPRTFLPSLSVDAGEHAPQFLIEKLKNLGVYSRLQ